MRNVSIPLGGVSGTCHSNLQSRQEKLVIIRNYIELSKVYIITYIHLEY